MLDLRPGDSGARQESTVLVLQPQPMGNGTGGGISPTPPARLPRPPWKLVLSVVLLGAVITGLCAQAAYLWADQAEDEWAARTEIEYRGNSWVESMEIAIQSQDVLTDVSFETGISVKDLEENLTASRVSGTQILRVEYQSVSQAEALAVVREVQLIFLRDFSLEPSITDDQVIEQRIELLEAELAEELERLRQLDVANESDIQSQEEIFQQGLVAELQREIQTLRGELLREQIQDEDIDEFQPRIIAQPYLLEEAVYPVPIRRAAFGILAGLVLSAALAFLILRRHLLQAA